MTEGEGERAKRQKDSVCVRERERKYSYLGISVSLFKCERLLSRSHKLRAQRRYELGEIER